jgi:hypothetical protein
MRRTLSFLNSTISIHSPVTLVPQQFSQVSRPPPPQMYGFLWGTPGGATLTELANRPPLTHRIGQAHGRFTLGWYVHLI